MHSDELREKPESMKLLDDLLSKQRYCVLATQNDGEPYGSLVAFAVSEDLARIVFPTSRSTRKFANILSNSRVAILIDNRENLESDVREATAVTACGVAEEAAQEEREAMLSLFLVRHPHLREFVFDDGTALIFVKVKTYYLVTRFQQVVRLEVTASGLERRP